LNPSIDRDLETVVLKAIEKEPSLRYASARELAADLRRILADQPVRARRPGIVRRAVNWSNRRRGAVVGSASVLVVGLLAGLIVLWEAKRRDGETLAEIERLRGQDRTALANALGALDQITRRIADARQRPRVEALADEAKHPVPYAIAFSDGIPRVFAHDFRMEELIAKALRDSGWCRLIRGDTSGRDDYRRAIQIYEGLASRFPEQPRFRTGLIETMREYASLLAEPIGSEGHSGAISRTVDLSENLIEAE
jgi:hypothetical protein